MIESETQLELHYSRYNCEDVLKSKYSWGDLLVDWEVSKKGSKCLVKRTLKPPKNTTPKKESITSKQEIEYFLLIDGMFCDYHATNAVCNIDNASEVILNLFNQLVYFDYLGINIYKQMTESNGINYNDLVKKQMEGSILLNSFFPDILIQNKNSFAFSETVEKINGFDCFRIEWANREILWVDARNFSIIRKRMSYFGDGLPIKYVVNFSDYRELKPDFWMPFSFDVDYYAYFEVEPKNDWGKIAKKQKYKVSLFQFEDIPDERFDISPEVGTAISDALLNENYRVSNPNSDPFAGPIGQGIRANRFVMIRAIIIMIGSAMILFGVWLKFRKKGA